MKYLWILLCAINWISIVCLLRLMIETEKTRKDMMTKLHHETKILEAKAGEYYYPYTTTDYSYHSSNVDTINFDWSGNKKYVGTYYGEDVWSIKGSLDDYKYTPELTVPASIQSLNEQADSNLLGKYS
jgi:hypothetical protein